MRPVSPTPAQSKAYVLSGSSMSLASVSEYDLEKETDKTLFVRDNGSVRTIRKDAWQTRWAKTREEMRGICSRVLTDEISKRKEEGVPLHVIPPTLKPFRGKIEL